FLHRDRTIGGGFRIGGIHNDDTAFIGDDHVAGPYGDAAARDRHAERSSEPDSLCRHSRKTAAPYGNLVLADLADVGDDTVDDHAGNLRDFRCISDEPAETCVSRVAAAVDHENVAGPDLSECVADDRPVDPRLVNGDRSPGDAHVRLHRFDAWIHESPIAEVADRRGLGANEFLHEVGTDLCRQWIQREHEIRVSFGYAT